jgi:ATP-dependent Lon protease
MLESAQIAWTFVKKRLIEEMHLSPAQLRERDIHIHIPAGAIPKDGPSAGAALAATLYSLFVKRPARSKLAMTGELSLTGRVLPIGGVREKLLAARRSGIEHVILPKENQRDLHDLPIELLKSLHIHFVSYIDEVFDLSIQPKSILGKTKKTVKKITPKKSVHTRSTTLNQ